MTKYYVGDGGNDGNTGLSHAQRWLTFSKVGTHMAASGTPGDEYLAADGSTFFEMLTVGVGGDILDTLRVGRYAVTGETTPPKISGLKVTVSGDWADQGGNIWEATLAGITAPMDFVRFGTIWGQKQTLVGNVNAVFEWFFNVGTSVLTVYSVGNPIAVYGSLNAIVLDNLIDFNEKDYVHIHGIVLEAWGAGGLFPGALKALKVAADQVGLFADYCRFDNLGIAPDTVGAVYVAGATLELRHCDATRASEFVELIAAGTVTVDSCLLVGLAAAFYGTGGTLTYRNNLIAGCLVTTSGTTTYIDGGGNIVNKDPGIASRLRYIGNTKMNISIDDLGGGPQETHETLLTMVQEFRNLKVNTGPSVGVNANGDQAAKGAAGDFTVDIVRKFRDWGVELCNHSYTHSRFLAGTWEKCFKLRYTAACTTATVEIGGTPITFTTKIDGAPDLQLDLTNALYKDVGKLVDHINGLGNYDAEVCSAVFVHRSTATAHLADVGAQNIKATYYDLLWDGDRLLPSEVKDNHDWFIANGITPSKVFIYPHGDCDEQIIGYVMAGANGGYTGARLAFIFQKTNLSSGYDVLKLNCVFVAESTYPTETEMRELVRRTAIWAQISGTPVVFYTHANNWTSPASIKWLLRAILDFGVYATLDEILADIKARDQVTADRIYAEADEVPVDWNRCPGSACLGNGDTPVKSWQDIRGSQVDPFTSATDIGALRG